jgi:hypothetical protein
MALLATLLLYAVPADAGPPSGAPAPSTSLVAGGLLLAQPAALSPGMTTGVDAAFTRGATLAWGVRAAWSAATEYTLAWTVRDDDLRVRLFGALQRAAGRGTFGLRLGVGGTLVREHRTRSQGSRAGLAGEDLEKTAWSVSPAMDLELTVALRIAGAWGMTLCGGPSMHLLHGSAHFGWLSGLGVTWQR